MHDIFVHLPSCWNQGFCIVDPSCFCQVCLGKLPVQYAQCLLFAHPNWANEHKNPLLFRGILGMKCYSVMCGLFHKPWNKDCYWTSSISRKASTVAQLVHDRGGSMAYDSFRTLPRSMNTLLCLDDVAKHLHVFFVGGGPRGRGFCFAMIFILC